MSANEMLVWYEAPCGTSYILIIQHRTDTPSVDSPKHNDVSEVSRYGALARCLGRVMWHLRKEVPKPSPHILKSLKS